MDNQQNKANSKELHPSQDFKVGQPVTFRGCKGIVKETDHHDTYPIYIEYTDKDGDFMSECFTYDGRLFDTSDIELFGLEESDKPEQAATTANKAPSLQTFKHIAEWIAKTSQFVEGDWYVGKGFLLNTLTTDELYQLYVYKGLEEGF